MKILLISIFAFLKSFSVDLLYVSYCADVVSLLQTETNIIILHIKLALLKACEKNLVGEKMTDGQTDISLKMVYNR